MRRSLPSISRTYDSIPPRIVPLVRRVQSPSFSVEPVSSVTLLSEDPESLTELLVDALFVQREMQGISGGLNSGGIGRSDSLGKPSCDLGGRESTAVTGQIEK